MIDVDVEEIFDECVKNEYSDREELGEFGGKFGDVGFYERCGDDGGRMKGC